MNSIYDDIDSKNIDLNVLNKAQKLLSGRVHRSNCEEYLSDICVLNAYVSVLDALDRNYRERSSVESNIQDLSASCSSIESVLDAQLTGFNYVEPESSNIESVDGVELDVDGKKPVGLSDEVLSSPSHQA